MRRLAITFMLAAGLVAAGCGDSGGGDVSKEDYIAAADKFCKEQNEEANKRSEDLQKAVEGVESEDELFEKITPQLEDAAEFTKDGFEEFKDIEPPAEDKETIDKLHAEMTKQVDLLDDIVQAAKDKDTQKFTQIAEQGDQIDTKLNQMAQDYGFKECGDEDSDVTGSS
jgi:hypothetical protein